MATRNAASLLPEALASIPGALGRAGLTYEIVVADGASQDATVAIAEAAPQTRIVSRRDDGIYDGMNRALAAARGDAVVILNSDDILQSNGIAAAWRELERAPECAYASGGVVTGTRAGEGAVRMQTEPLTVEGALFGIPVINARLFRTGLFARIGPFATEVGLAADREFMIRLARSKARSAIVNQPFYFYRSHPGSSTIASDIQGRRRVYDAEARHAAYLIARWRDDPEIFELARSAYALADAKLRIAAAGRAGDRWAVDGDFAPRLRHRVKSLALAWRWRGRLSGA